MSPFPSVEGILHRSLPLSLVNDYFITLHSLKLGNVTVLVDFQSRGLVSTLESLTSLGEIRLRSLVYVESRERHISVLLVVNLGDLPILNHCQSSSLVCAWSGESRHFRLWECHAQSEFCIFTWFFRDRSFKLRESSSFPLGWVGCLSFPLYLENFYTLFTQLNVLHFHSENILETSRCFGGLHQVWWSDLTFVNTKHGV